MDRDEYIRQKRKQERIKKAKRKNMIIYVETALILILSVALIAVSILYSGAKKELSAAESEVNSSFDSAVSDTDSEYLKSEVDEWYLMLVNPDNAVSSEFIRNVNLTAIKSGYHDGTDSGMYLDSRIVGAFNSMCEAAEKDGIKLYSESAYRTYAYQETLFNNRVKRFENQGHSHSEAVEKTATMIATPGTSEHHLGLGVDINLVDESFEDTAEFRWLKENAENYGFVMRYPKDKQEITKIIYEPWHYRYVGVEHAKAINELNMCLEEYIEYLSNGGV